MKPRTVIILVVIVFFLIAVGLSLLREVNREQAKLERSISGLVEVSNAMLSTGQADIVRTDRLALMLIDPRTGDAVALKTLSPFIPPQAVAIGQEDAQGDIQLEGRYYLMGITDKDGDIAAPTRGEVFGRSPEPIALGKEQVRLLLDQPFRGQVPPLAPASYSRPSQTTIPLPNQGLTARWERPAPLGENLRWSPVRVGNPCEGMEGGGTMIEGRITASPELAERLRPGERLVIRILIPGEPTLTGSFVYSQFSFPYRFRIGPSTSMSGAPPRKAQVVEAFTRPADAAEVAAVKTLLARGEDLLPLGTMGLQLELKPVAQ